MNATTSSVNSNERCMTQPKPLDERAVSAGPATGALSGYGAGPRKLSVGMRCVFTTDSFMAVRRRNGHRCVIASTARKDGWDWRVEFAPDDVIYAMSVELVPVECAA